MIRYSSNPFPEHTYRLHGRLDENTGGEFQFLYRKDFENSWSQACCRTGRHVSNGMQYLSFLSRSSLLSFLSLPLLHFTFYSNSNQYAQVEVEVKAFSDITDDVDFMRKLLAEESVFVLPGNVSTCCLLFHFLYIPPLYILFIESERKLIVL